METAKIFDMEGKELTVIDGGKTIKLTKSGKVKQTKNNQKESRTVYPIKDIKDVERCKEFLKKRVDEAPERYKKSYAKVLFVVGLDYPNFEQNLNKAILLNEKVKMLNPNLSRGVLKKTGKNVNGIYNQDFNENVILIEIGGYESTTTEVLNSSLAFAKCFMEAINE